MSEMVFEFINCINTCYLNQVTAVFKLGYNINSLKQMKQKQTPKITVAIRKRPLNKKELGRGESDIIKIDNRQSIVVSEYKQKVDLTKYIEQTTFNFDYAFNEDSTNEQIYRESIRPLIDSAFQGAKISCFAYGQTGSGKTFTMKGDINKGVPGLYYLAAQEIFNYLDHPQFQRFNILVSFYEIYCGKLYDLLNSRNELKIREDKHANINIIGLEQKPIYSANQFLDIIQEGSTLRITSQNATNPDSSRSHAIMQIHIKDGKKVFSKVSFIDLAGNERGADHMDQNKQTKIDGAQINKSLLALKQCIRALDQGKGHTPFRGSKLTMVLKDSFVGFCKTVMIGNVSPNVSSSQNTMNTLRYADRVKQLKRPSQNLTREQIQAKELMLPRAANKNTIKVTIEKEDDADDIRNKLDLAKKKFTCTNENDKMEIQLSKQKEPLTLERRAGGSHKEVMIGKRTDSVSNNHRIHQKKSPYNSKQEVSSSKQQTRNNENINSAGELGSRKNLMSNAPLNQKNVIKKKIDQNNINTSNQEPLKNKPSFTKSQPSQLSILPLEQLNRQHFDVMNNLHSQFSKFKDNHSKFVKQQTIIIRDQMTTLGQMSEIQQFNNDADDYLNLVEKSIQEKIRLMQALGSEVQSLRKRKNDADQINKVLQQQRVQQQSKYRPGAMQLQFPKGHNISSMINPVKYTYHSSIQQQQSQISYDNVASNQPHRVPQSYNQSIPYQYNYSYSNINNSNGTQNNQNIQYAVSNNGYNGGGYQYNQNNSYTPNFPNHDEQLLEDLPGDENMQRLF